MSVVKVDFIVGLSSKIELLYTALANEVATDCMS